LAHRNDSALYGFYGVHGDGEILIILTVYFTEQVV
jgi:hypothetical protein